MTEMTDEEFIEFINANKERMNTLMGDDDSVKAFLKDNAKKAKKKIEETGDAVEDTVKKVFEGVVDLDGFDIGNEME